MNVSMHPDAHMHRSAARVVAAVKQDINTSHEYRDPDIETAVIDDNGALHPSGSSVTIPLGDYYLPPSVAQDKPTLGSGDAVLVVWADQGQNRRPYVIMITTDVVPEAETGVLNVDGTILTKRGVVVPAVQVALAESIRNRAAGVPYGLSVVAIWTDREGDRMLRVVDVV